jgi:phage terminase large subunit-like protein
VSSNKGALLSELAEVKAQEERLRRLRPNEFFRPMPGGQTRFWHDNRHELWIFGANQSGKTTTLINRVIRMMKTTPGLRVYIGSPSMDRSRKVTQKTFRDWCDADMIPPGTIFSEDRGFKDDVCKFVNGSIVFFLSYEMEPDKWASDTLNIVGFDEEPPWHIFTEAQKRIIALDGYIFGAMTSLKSYTRLVNRVYLEGNPKIGLFTVPLHENHVKHGGKFTDDRLVEIVNETPASERPSRIFGIPTYRTGLVYDEWRDEEPFIIPRNKEFAIPNEWTRYLAIDPHGSINQAALCIAVGPRRDMYIYKEFWVKALIPDFARILKLEGAAVPFEASLIDNHYSTQKNSESGRTIKELLIEYGDIFTIGGCDDVLARIDMVKAWDRINPATKKPMIQTFESCAQTRWERKRYEWESPISERVAERRESAQRPKDKYGHLMNCLEYLAAYGGKDGLEYILPRLSPEMERKAAYYQQREREQAEVMARDFNGEQDDAGQAFTRYKDSLAYQYS